jgi:hypothetical protein
MFFVAKTIPEKDTKDTADTEGDVGDSTSTERNNLFNKKLIIR